MCAETLILYGGIGIGVSVAIIIIGKLQFNIGALIMSYYLKHNLTNQVKIMNNKTEKSILLKKSNPDWPE